MDWGEGIAQVVVRGESSPRNVQNIGSISQEESAVFIIDNVFDSERGELRGVTPQDIKQVISLINVTLDLGDPSFTSPSYRYPASRVRGN